MANRLLDLDIAIGVTTAPREPNYLRQSIASIRASGFQQVAHVFTEPSASVACGPCEVIHSNDTQLGCYLNWRRGLEWLLLHTTAPWLLMMQDDAYWSPTGGVALAESLQSGTYDHVGLLSPYTSPAMVSDDPATGWQPAAYRGKSFWGAVALCLPRPSAELLVSSPIFRGHTHHRKLDTVIGDTMRSLGKEVLVHVPSLVQHIGDVSTLGRHRIRGIQWARKGYKFGE